MLTRPRFTVTNVTTVTTTGSFGLQACSSPGESYDEAAPCIWRVGDVAALPPTQLQRELVRLATLAPSSHNTQCWRAIAERQHTRGEYDGKPLSAEDFALRATQCCRPGWCDAAA